MTRINLLPEEIKEKSGQPRLIPWFIVMALVVVAIIVGLFFLFSSQKSSKADDLKQKQEELAGLQKQTKPIEKFETQQQDLSSLKSLYEESNSGRVAWAQMLNELAMCVPEGLATASNPKAPSIWLAHLTMDAQPLEASTGGASAQSPSSSVPVKIEGYAAPAWLCIQTWLPRASDFKSKGFLDAYPYYYYFKGQPKVAELFVRLQNMGEWTNLWITDSKEESIQEKRIVATPSQPGQVQEETYSDWAIHFTIEGRWNNDKAIWKSSQSSTGG